NPLRMCPAQCDDVLQAEDLAWHIERLEDSGHELEVCRGVDCEAQIGPDQLWRDVCEGATAKAAGLSEVGAPDLGVLRGCQRARALHRVDGYAIAEGAEWQLAHHAGEVVSLLDVMPNHRIRAGCIDERIVSGCADHIVEVMANGGGGETGQYIVGIPSVAFDPETLGHIFELIVVREG